MNRGTKYLEILYIMSIVWLLVIAYPRSSVAEDARESYQLGVDLYKEGKHQEAVVAFRKAYSLRPTWKLLYNIAQCEASLKRYGLALEAFEAYLLEGGDEIIDERRDYVATEIRRIQPLVGLVEVNAPEDINVMVDGSTRATTPLKGPLRVAAGTHIVELRQGDESLYKKELRIGGGMTTSVAIDEELEESPPPPLDEKTSAPEEAEPEPMRAESPEKSLALKISGWTVLGIGAAALIGGAITGGMAVAKVDDLNKQCPDKQCPDEEDENLVESAENLGVATNVLLIAGGGLAALGAVLLIVDWRKNTPRESMKARIGPVMDQNQMGIAIMGEF